MQHSSTKQSTGEAITVKKARLDHNLSKRKDGQRWKARNLLFTQVCFPSKTLSIKSSFLVSKPTMPLP